MTPHQTLAVAVRLFALWLAIYAARELVGAYVAGRERSDTHILPMVGVVSTLAIIFLAALWFFPKSIARGLLPSSTDAPAKPASPDTWVAVGSESVDRSGVIPGLYLSVQVAVGAGLIFGANAVRRFILWARYAGPD